MHGQAARSSTHTHTSVSRQRGQIQSFFQFKIPVIVTWWYCGTDCVVATTNKERRGHQMKGRAMNKITSQG
jgi:hypothetical protein